MIHYIARSYPGAILAFFDLSLAMYTSKYVFKSKIKLTSSFACLYVRLILNARPRLVRLVVKNEFP